MGFVILSEMEFVILLSIIFVAEVRPAPHMDNLVGIYKSMEDASGINIFMTQNAPSTKSSGIFCTCILHVIVLRFPGVC